MKIRLLSILVVGLLSSGLGVIYAADSLAEKEATPTIKERLTKDTIKGTLMTSRESTPLKITTGKSISFISTGVPS
jgi:hypothetical protein